MDKRGVLLTLGALGFVLIPIVIYSLVVSRPAASPQIEKLAQCLADKDAKMYGAFWCAHCQSQKRLFGTSFSKIKYIECSLPDGKTQTQECQEVGIKSYPTWEFNDGSRLEGQISLAVLAQKADCEEVKSE